MRSLDRINEYVNIVCRQMRWKKAHIRVSEEMKNHIVDGRDSYMEQGFDEETATEKALIDTGDATTIGTQLDRIHRPKPQWGMFVATAALLTLGILIRLFIFRDEDRAGLLSIRLFYTGIGVAGMIAAYFTDFTIIGKYPKTIYFGVALLLLAMLLFSPTVQGKVFYAQYIILLFPLAFTAIIYATRNLKYLGMLICGLAFWLLSFITLFVPSVSGYFHFLIISVALLGITIYKKWFGVKRIYGFLVMLFPLAIPSLIFFIGNAYRWNRLAVALNPYLDPTGPGYIGIMTRKLLRSAILFGRGNIPGEYIVGVTEPNRIFYTDLFLTALISLLGWIAFAIIISAILIFIVIGFKRCFKQKSSLGLFVSISIMMTFCMQAISYIAYNFGFQLAAPISLPLISYGNTATVINLVLIGFMLSVFRTGDAVIDKTDSPSSTRNRLFSICSFRKYVKQR